MSYQIYYKFKTFKDNNGNLFVFSLDGSNNSFFVTRRGTQVRERDWRMFFRGTQEELKQYLAKIDTYNEGFNVSRSRSISRALLFEKLTQTRAKPLDQFFNIFITANRHQYEKEDVSLSLSDLYDFKESDYFAVKTNEKGNQEYLFLEDNYFKKFKQERCI